MWDGGDMEAMVFRRHVAKCQAKLSKATIGHVINGLQFVFVSVACLATNHLTQPDGTRSPGGKHTNSRNEDEETMSECHSIELDPHHMILAMPGF